MSTFHDVSNQYDLMNENGNTILSILKVVLFDDQTRAKISKETGLLDSYLWDLYDLADWLLRNEEEE